MEEMQKKLQEQQEIICQFQTQLATISNKQALDEVRSGSNLKLPTFWQRDPVLWFAQVEAQFNCARIRSDQTKYWTVVTALDCATLQPVADLVANPPTEETKYESIKSRLIAAYADTPEKRLRKLMYEIELEDKQPSQLLREMEALAGKGISGDVLKTLWLQRLPPQLQMILAANDKETLDKMATIADKLTEIHHTSAITANIGALNRGTSAHASQTVTSAQEMEWLPPLRHCRSSS
ncbi:hypothetical protein Zmor_015723 [Zophobas morio]|uniref:DUF7041 domain-containing protein n=1 Tax=Zophobas morio TaxID=2755281 RepID=A0AA38IF01_9CUCU|nr:hypothetical protein Zmor_015723 [Zophobas morio]